MPSPRNADADEDHKQSNAMFILKTSEVRKLTITAVNNILSDIELLVEDAMVTAQKKTECSLRACGINPSSIPSFYDNFCSLMKPFVGLDSEYLQMKYFRETLGLIVSVFVCCNDVAGVFQEPQEIILGSSVFFDSSGLVRNYDKFYYVSLKATLEKVMNINFVLDQVIINIFISTKYN